MSREKKPMKLKTAEALSAYGFLAPWIIGLVVFSLIPVGYSLFLSFQEVTLSPYGIETAFIGAQWYQEAFQSDATFVLSLLDTLQFIALSTPMVVVAALLLALLLNGKYRGRVFFRALFFFPVIIISGPVVAELINSDAAKIVSADQYGIYAFIQTLPSVLSAPLAYIFDHVVLILWFSGVQIVIFLAGLQKIGPPIYEAASIDGASSWQIFWKIILPFLRPMMLLNAVYTVVELSAFANNQVNNEIVNKMTLTGKVYGYSAALSWIYFGTLAVLLVIVFLLFRKRKEKY